MIAYVFTKDRACQAHLLLESLGRNLPGVFEPYVVWKASGGEYRDAYDLLWTRFPAGRFVEDASPRQDMLDACRYANGRDGLVGLFTDDCVVWRKASITPDDVRLVMTMPRVVCASLRLGRNTTTQNYLTGQVQPDLDAAEPYRIDASVLDGEAWLAWEYCKFHFADNFGYVAGMDGHVFRASDLCQWLVQLRDMKTYRDWEGSLHLPGPRRQMADARPLMACPETSCVVNVPANSVQVDPTLSGQRHAYPTAELNERYLAGEVIDLDAVPFGEVRSSHAEYPFSFKAC